MKRNKNLLSIILVLVIAIASLPLNVSGSDVTNIKYTDKIAADLFSIMEKSDDEEKIPVYIWLNDIDREQLKKDIYLKTGMDPDVYEDISRFESEIVPEVTKEIVDRVGYEKAYEKEEVNISDEVDEVNEVNDAESDNVKHDNTMSLVDRAIHAKFDEYNIKRKEVLADSIKAYKNDLIKRTINNDDNIIFNSEFTTTIIAKLTKKEINTVARDPKVEEITYYRDLKLVPALSNSETAVNADPILGTKSILYNNGNGYYGTNIKIGIVEAEGGKYRSNAPMLSSIHKSGRLSYVNNGNVVGIENDHATVVTSIIVGQSTTVNGLRYEGIVPGATVIQTSCYTVDDLYRGIELLAKSPYNCNVINLSLGVDSGTGYTDIDRQIDKYIDSFYITIVIAAGNRNNRLNDNVMSPGKAFSAITVGNAVTNSTNYGYLFPPYTINNDSSATSSFVESTLITNKPDISAPGTRIRIPKSSSAFYYENGKYSTGTSFATPHVAGVVAQMIQADYSLKSSPKTVKAIILASTINNSISTTNNNSVASAIGYNSSDTGAAFRDRSGAGFLSATRTINSVLSNNDYYNITKCNSSSIGIIATKTVYLEAGEKLKVALTYNKIYGKEITSVSTQCNLDLKITPQKSGGSQYTTVACSTRNNVEIICYTAPVSGYYTISVEMVSNDGSGDSVGYAFTWEKVSAF